MLNLLAKTAILVILFQMTNSCEPPGIFLKFKKILISI